MQVTNNYQPNFKATATYAAERAIESRMPKGKAKILKEYIRRMYNGTDFDVELHTISFGGSLLNAMIRYKGKFVRYAEESILSGLRSPKKFVDEVRNVIENEIKPNLSKMF